MNLVRAMVLGLQAGEQDDLPGYCASKLGRDVEDEEIGYHVQRLLRRNPAISARLTGASALRAKVFAQPLSQQPAYVLIGVEFSLQ